MTSAQTVEGGDDEIVRYSIIKKLYCGVLLVSLLLPFIAVPSVQAGTASTLVTGAVKLWGPSVPSEDLSGVTAIAAGGWHSLALKGDGTVVAWGYNHSGRAMVPAGLSGVTAIAVGAWHSLALKVDLTDALFLPAITRQANVGVVSGGPRVPEGSIRRRKRK